MRTTPCWIVCALLGCAPAQAPTPRPTRPASKQSLFGDAGLVPTREGERARTELAMAAELERLLASAEIPGAVSVSLVEPASAVIVASAGDHDTIHRLAEASLPAIASDRIHVEAVVGDGDSPAEPPTRAIGLPALLLTLGFGVALGVTVERAMQGRPGRAR